MRYDILHAFGDSFVVGDQDDFLHDHPKGVVPNHSMEYEERIQYLKNNVSFASIIAKHYVMKLQNHAIRGSGNFPQLDKLFLALIQGKIKSNDIVLFGLTTLLRDRFNLHEYEKAKSYNYGPLLIDRDLLHGDNKQHIFDMDYYYILSTLENLSKKFNVRIIKINLFNNLVDESPHHENKLFNFPDLIGKDIKGNTLIDILNDTWGKGISNPYHDILKVSPGYEHLYTVKKHPSVEGHKKIANWFINNNILYGNNIN